MLTIIPVSAIVVIIDIIVKIYMPVRIKNHRHERTGDEVWRWLCNNGWPSYDCSRKGFQVCPFRCNIRYTASHQETED
jgi:hypothetical protein